MKFDRRVDSAVRPQIADDLQAQVFGRDAGRQSALDRDLDRERLAVGREPLVAALREAGLLQQLGIAPPPPGN